MTVGLSPVLRIARPGVLLHYCEACAKGHTINIHDVSHDGRVLGWDGCEHRPSIAEPVRHEHDGAVCEYILRAGVMYFMESCTHPLKGQSRHLIPYPMP